MPPGRGRPRVAGDVVLAVHELAAMPFGIVREQGGCGSGNWPEALRRQMDDGDPSASGHLAGEASGTDAPGQAPEESWPSLPRHGLRLVRRVADQMRIVTGPRGTRATIIFDLP